MILQAQKARLTHAQNTSPNFSKSPRPPPSPSGVHSPILFHLFSLSSSFLLSLSLSLLFLLLLLSSPFLLPSLFIIFFFLLNNSSSSSRTIFLWKKNYFVEHATDTYSICLQNHPSIVHFLLLFIPDSCGLVKFLPCKSSTETSWIMNQIDLFIINFSCS